MSILQKLKRTLDKFNTVSIFNTSVAEQENFLQRLPAPRDDWERSYLQYRCQNFLMRRGLPLLLNCIAIPLLPIYERKLLNNETPEQKRHEAKKELAILLFSGAANIVPISLGQEFDIFQEKNFQENLHLNQSDRDYLHQLRRRYPFAFYFRLKCMLKLAMYSYIIDFYRPKAILCSEEYSFTCSLLTDYCQSRSVAHINVMHGEKAFFIRDTFIHFDRFYIWDLHYKHLFKDLGAEETQFRIEIPPSLRLPSPASIEKTVDYTYYLGNETREQIEHILSNLTILQNRGAIVAIRLHPIYFSSSKFLCEDNRGFLIEQNDTCSIEESLLRTNCVLSLYSTVLLQASFNNIPYAIDDLSNPTLLQQTMSMRYLSYSKPHTLLSELIS